MGTLLVQTMKEMLISVINCKISHLCEDAFKRKSLLSPWEDLVNLYKRWHFFWLSTNFQHTIYNRPIYIGIQCTWNKRSLKNYLNPKKNWYKFFKRCLAITVSKFILNLEKKVVEIINKGCSGSIWRNFNHKLKKKKEGPNVFPAGYWDKLSNDSCSK